MTTDSVVRVFLRLSFRGAPPGGDRFCRLLPLLACSGVQTIIVDWEESFPWAIDERMRGAGVFREEEVLGMQSVASSAGIELIPRLARCGLPFALDRVAGFSHLSGFAADGEPPEVAAAAVRMVDRLVDDMLEVFQHVPRLAVGAAEQPDDGAPQGKSAGAAERLDGHGRQQHLEVVCSLLRGRGMDVVFDSLPEREPAPVECAIAAALSLDDGAVSPLAREVLPVAGAFDRTDRFVRDAWRELQVAAGVLVRACRDQGERSAFLSNDSTLTQVECILQHAEALHAEVMPLLVTGMEPAVAGTLLAARLSPIEELAVLLRQRMRALRY